MICVVYSLTHIINLNGPDGNVTCLVWWRSFALTAVWSLHVSRQHSDWNNSVYSVYTFLIAITETQQCPSFILLYNGPASWSYSPRCGPYTYAYIFQHQWPMLVSVLYEKNAGSALFCRKAHWIGAFSAGCCSCYLCYCCCCCCWRSGDHSAPGLSVINFTSHSQLIITT